MIELCYFLIMLRLGAKTKEEPRTKRRFESVEVQVEPFGNGQDSALANMEQDEIVSWDSPSLQPQICSWSSFPLEPSHGLKILVDFFANPPKDDSPEDDGKMV